MEPVRALAPAVPGIEHLVEIGRGGAGVVYRGRQVGLDRDVAVKVVMASGAPQEAARRWRREVTAMGRLSHHPNIIDVYDGGFTEDGQPFLVMPFVPGGTLESRIRAERSLEATEVVSLGRKLADALAAAHASGVLHRDVKPANVLVSPYGEPLLTDFGIAQLADTTATMTARVHATVAFAAPEVLSGQSASVASDVYSLAATLHTCLTGAPPHGSSAGESLVSLAMRVVTEPPADLRAAGVEPGLAGVIERAMAKDPAQRTASAAALADALAALDGSDLGEPTIAAAPTRALPDAVVGPPPEPRWAASAVPPPTPPAPPAPTAPSRPRRGAALAAAAVAAVVIAAVAIAAAGGDDGGRGLAGAPTTTAGAAPASTAPETTTRPASPAGDSLTSAAAAYIAALAGGDFEGAYAMTTPGFQQAQPFDGYIEFWGGFDTIAVDGEPQVDEAASSVTLRLQLDGSTESYTLELVRGDGGLLVDGPRPR